MANLWPIWEYFNLNLSFINKVDSNTINFSIYTSASISASSSPILPINRARTKSINRIGPHNKEVLDLIICGMLGDFWADKIQGKTLNSVRFNIEQSITNTAYIHNLT